MTSVGVFYAGQGVQLAPLGQRAWRSLGGNNSPLVSLGWSLGPSPCCFAPLTLQPEYVTVDELVLWGGEGGGHNFLALLLECVSRPDGLALYYEAGDGAATRDEVVPFRLL